MDFTPAIDPATGDLSIDDGSPAAAPSVAIGLIVFTLRTPLGSCPAAPWLGVDWSVAQVDVPGATVTLQNELTRALGWVVDGGWMRNLTVAVTRTGRGRLAYEIAFDPPEGGARRTIRGTV